MMASTKIKTYIVVESLREEKREEFDFCQQNPIEDKKYLVLERCTMSLFEIVEKLVKFANK